MTAAPLPVVARAEWVGVALLPVVQAFLRRAALARPRTGR